VPLHLFSYWLFPRSPISLPDDDGVTSFPIFPIGHSHAPQFFFVMNILMIHFPLFIFSHDPLSLRS